jgi:predicted nuclease of predicted toxin-antitoxin system
VKWLIDAQLPPRLAALFRERGYDAIRTLDLPDGNRTPDEAIIACAVRESRIVVTKDADFVPHCVFRRRPQKLLPIATGNIRNQALETLLAATLPQLAATFGEHDFVELTINSLIVRTVSGDDAEGGADAPGHS